MTAIVGMAYFHADPEDEDKDFIRVTPKDGSEPFLWSQMTDVKEIVEYANSKGAVMLNIHRSTIYLNHDGMSIDALIIIDELKTSKRDNTKYAASNQNSQSCQGMAE